MTKNSNKCGLSDGEVFILKIFKKFNCDSGDAFPIMFYMLRLAELNLKQKNEQEFAFDSLKENGFIEEKIIIFLRLKIETSYIDRLTTASTRTGKTGCAVSLCSFYPVMRSVMCIS